MIDLARLLVLLAEGFASQAVVCFAIVGLRFLA